MKKFTSILLGLCLAGFVVGCGGSATAPEDAKNAKALEADPDYEKQMMGGGDAKPPEKKTEKKE